MMSRKFLKSFLNETDKRLCNSLSHMDLDRMGIELFESRPFKLGAKKLDKIKILKEEIYKII